MPNTPYSLTDILKRKKVLQASNPSASNIEALNSLKWNPTWELNTQTKNTFNDYVPKETNQTTWTLPSWRQATNESTIQTEEQKQLQKQNEDLNKINQSAVDNIVKTQNDWVGADVDLLKQKKELAESNAKEIQAEQEAEYKRQQSAMEQQQAEFERQTQLKAEQEQEILKTQQTVDLEQTKAEWENLKAKQKQAEEEAKINIEFQAAQARFAFDKLGMNFSWAAITWVQWVTNDAILSLATLKSKNALDYADWAKKASDISIKYTNAINKSMNDAADKVAKSRQDLNKTISEIKSNIITSKKDKAKAMEKAIDDFIKWRNDVQDNLFKKIETQNKIVKQSHDDILANINKQKESYKTTLETLVNNGQINSMSRAQVNELERKAWLPEGSAINSTLTATYNKIVELSSQMGFGTEIPSEVLAKITLDIRRASALNVPLNIAIGNAFSKYSKELPWYNAKIEANKLANKKAEAEIEKILSEAEENRSQVSKNKRTWSWGWGTELAKLTSQLKNAKTTAEADKIKAQIDQINSKVDIDEAKLKIEQDKLQLEKDKMNPMSAYNLYWPWYYYNKKLEAEAKAANPFD